jgi:hypothetical protein
MYKHVLTNDDLLFTYQGPRGEHCRLLYTLTYIFSIINHTFVLCASQNPISSPCPLPLHFSRPSTKHSHRLPILHLAVHIARRDSAIHCSPSLVAAENQDSSASPKLLYGNSLRPKLHNPGNFRTLTPRLFRLSSCVGSVHPSFPAHRPDNRRMPN